MVSLARVAALESSGARAALVTVVRTSGSTPRSSGARMVVFNDGGIEGTVGGGRVELEVVAAAREAIDERRARFVEFKLMQELGMCCGGQVALFIEPFVVAPRLIMFGAGPIGTALCAQATRAGFVVHVVEGRDGFPIDMPDAHRVHLDWDDPELPFDSDAFVVLVTGDHPLDQRLVTRILTLPHRWFGSIGSLSKAEKMKRKLAEAGFDADTIDRLRIPVGLAIGAATKAEIAIAILAELVAVRRGVPVNT